MTLTMCARGSGLRLSSMLERPTLEADIERLERGLDDIAMHRQKIINWALAGKFDFSEIRTVVNQDNSISREFLGGSSLKDFKLWEAK